MIFHFALNAFFIFLILSLCVECILAVFKIENHRMRYCARLLPLIKLPFDLLFFALFDEIVFVNFNPFSCEVYFSEFLAALLPINHFAEMASTGHIVIPVYLAALIPSTLLNFMMLLLLIAAASCFSLRLYQFLQGQKHFQEILRHASFCTRPIENRKLQDELDQFQAIVLISTHVSVPLAGQLRYVIFPQDLLLELSQEEFEAVVAHELEHLRWGDPLVRFFCLIIASVFWWIPTRWWLDRLESDQEEASDFSLHRYGLSQTVLAEALLKVIMKVKTTPYCLSALCPLASSKGKHIERFHKLLSSKAQKKCARLFFKHTLVLVCLVFAFFSVWMC